MLAQTFSCIKDNLSLVATIHGKPLLEFPSDLYIPPQALKVLLETFSGPLDLLLYLIKKQNFDIVDIPVAEISRQYIQYIELMNVLEVELVAEYLVMAAVLIEIKSRLLLPKQPLAITDEEALDPRMELIQRLQAYEQIKDAAADLNQRHRYGRDFFLAYAETNLDLPSQSLQQIPRTFMVTDLLCALQAVFERASLLTHHTVMQEPMSVKDRMQAILVKLASCSQTEFSTLLNTHEGRRGVVVTFLALLELGCQAILELIQTIPYGFIQVNAR